MMNLTSQINLWAILDIGLIAFIIYHLLIILRGTRAAQIFTGIIILIGSFFVLSQLYPLTTFKWVMNKFYSSFIIILVVLFQEDIRMMLVRMGKKPLLPSGESFSSKQILDEIVKAAATLAQNHTGALIVIERNIILSRYVDIGVLIDARVSSELLVSIFHPSSPIHDGAVIIQEGRCAAAGCFLPLTRDENIDLNFGTRNRAAIGISQETDALVVLVSEEEGTISVVQDGNVERHLTPKDLRKILWDRLNASRPNQEDSAVQPTTNLSFLSKMRSLRKSK